MPVCPTAQPPLSAAAAFGSFTRVKKTGANFSAPLVAVMFWASRPAG